MHTEIRKRLKLARIGQRYSQRALADAAGFSLATISLLERDATHDPRLSVTRSIARVLGDPHLFCIDCDEAVS